MFKISIFLYLLFMCNVYADLLLSPVVDGCSVDTLGFTDHVSINAVFEPKSITCPSGQFLPANNVNCEVCPNDSTCAGGTWTFNETKSHGIILNSVFSQNQSKSCDNNLLGIGNDVSINAVFVPKSITCDAGQYLPMNSESCTNCPVGYKCVGGTYVFNENTNQGFEECPNGTHAPGGTAYCYEHILHIGDDIIYIKSVKITTPSLCIGMDSNVYYANMTTIPTYMNSESEHYLKIQYNDTTYYVCDDTACPNIE